MSISRRHLVVLTIFALACATSVTAEQGDKEVGFRLFYATASASSAGTVADTASSITLSSGPGVEINWLLYPLDELSVELSIGASPHPVGTSGGSLGGLDGGTLWRLPVSAVAQYRPDLFGEWNPYIGLGLVYNATVYDMSAAYKEWLSDADFSSDVGIVVQVGIDYTLNVRWSANLDLRYMGMRTTATLEGLDGAILDELDFKLDPWVIGLGFRYRY
jgi:outer membrane protein